MAKLASDAKNSLAAAPVGVLAALVACVALIAVLLRSLGEASAHGYVWWPPSEAVWALLRGEARSALLLSLLAAVFLILPWWACGRTRRPRVNFARSIAVFLALGVWAWRGYAFNRFEAAILWRTRVEWAPLPRALFDPSTLGHNVLLTLSALGLAIVVYALLMRVLPSRWPQQTRSAAPIASLAASMFLPLLLLSLRPAQLGQPLPPGGDIILVSLDAVRADHLGAYGYERPTSPELDRFATESIRFTRAYSQEPWTLTSHMSMLTGLYPDAHGLDFGRSLHSSVWTLAERLRESGYRTAASVYDCFLLSPRFGYAAGFDSYHESSVPAWERAESAAEWLLADERPGFLFLHFYDPHSDTGVLPYEASDASQRLMGVNSVDAFDSWTGEGGASETLRRVNEEGLEMGAALQESLVDLYDAGLRDTDAALGRFLDALRASGRFENATIVVLADHGEALGEREHFMHEVLMEATVRIPLMWRRPGGEAAGTVRNDLVETVDLMPSILRDAEIAPPELGQGRELQVESGRDFVFHRSGPRRAITTDDGWRLSYDLRDGEIVPVELRRVDGSGGDGLDQLTDSLVVFDRWLEEIVLLQRANQSMQDALRGADVQMDKADEDLLRSLGYIK